MSTSPTDNDDQDMPASPDDLEAPSENDQTAIPEAMATKPAEPPRQSTPPPSSPKPRPLAALLVRILHTLSQ